MYVKKRGKEETFVVLNFMCGQQVTDCSGGVERKEGGRTRQNG